MAEKNFQEVVKEQVEKENQANDDIQKINRIIKGENDMFEKDYEFKEFDLRFTIKVRFPNAIEQAQVQSIVSSYFNGMNRWMTESLLETYSTLALLSICGEDVPEFLKNPEKLYNIQIPAVIGVDIREWMNTFQI